VPAPKWLVIARNEYRIHTSGIRSIRPYFPYLVVGLLAVYVGLIAPTLVGIFVDEVLAFLLSQAAAAMMYIMLFLFFFYFIILPISNTLKEAQTSEYELLLSAPIKSSDVLLGKFLGVAPFYAIAIVAIVGTFVAFLGPLGLDAIQITITLMVFAITLLSALWIGSVIAAILKTRLGKTARGRDIGRALSLVVALPLVALMYSITGGGLLQALADPGTGGFVKSVLSLLPSSWGAEVIAGFMASPGNIAGVWLGTLAGFGGLVAFFAVALWLGAKAAGRAYSLELTGFASAKAKPDGAFYKTVKFLSGRGSFGILVVSIFKDYGRRLENLSKVAYVVGLLILMGVFFGGFQDPEGMLTMGLFLFPLLSVFVMGEVTVRGKGNFFIYRKAPAGEGRLIKARLLQGCIVLIPIAAGYSLILMGLVLQTPLLTSLVYAGLMALTVAAYAAFSLGIFLLMPVFSDKPAEQVVNMVTVMMVSIFLFIITRIVFGSFTWLIFFPLLVWLIGAAFLYLGKRRLSRIE